jgi:hypothetical protein
MAERYPPRGHSLTHAVEGGASGSIPASLSSTCSAQEHDLDRLHPELKHVDKLIHLFTEERARILREINNTQVLTRRLPSEVLSTIFQLTRSPTDLETRIAKSNSPIEINKPRSSYFSEDDFHHLVLGAVSHHWRQIVRSTPQLWSTLSIEVYEPVSENNVSLLNLYFENARGLPMTIELDMRYQLSLLEDLENEERAETLSRLEPIRKAVFINNAHKIRDLILPGLPLEWTRSIGSSLAHCRSLSLSWPVKYSQAHIGERDLLALLDLPALQQVSINTVSTPFALRWSSITVLRLRGVLSSHCFYLLAKCPNLVEVDCQERKMGGSAVASKTLEPLPRLDQPIVLQHLKRLLWCFTDDREGHDFLRSIRFIKLHTLSLHDPHHDSLIPQHTRSLLTSFFSDLPQTIQSLALNRVSSLPPPMLTSLTELILRECDVWMVESVLFRIGHPIHAMDADSRTESNPNLATDCHQSDVPRFLASLETLHVLDDVGRYAGSRRPELVVRMLETLYEVRGIQKPFRLKLSVNQGWNHCLTERLRKLAASGFRLDITLGSHRLGLLSPRDGMVEAV